MSGIRVLTALEIYTNPDDLEIVIVKDAQSEKFALGVSRGPGHNFKPLLSSKPFAKDIDSAIDAVRRTLEAIQEFATTALGEETDVATRYLILHKEEDKQQQTLDAARINRILEQLRAHEKASTYAMPAITN